MKKKYSLWKIEHESEYRATAFKVKDTDSIKEVERWENESWLNVASFYRNESELNAAYFWCHLQTTKP